MAPRKKNPKLKRTIKYLATCKHPEIISRIIAKSPDNVIKSICDATINAARGEVSLSQKRKKILPAHRKLIQRLIQRGEPANRMQHLIYQKGESILGLVRHTVLGAVISSVGQKLFS